ncbi:MULTISPECIES: beta-carotene 15,15'-monooxygenase [Epilithonimonas]|uniref:Beta-carotene 15,15'-monooxygenase n=1 Tax=Epilithonimonas hominis TaxID=420404 RepID=A0A3N0X469_9FLAO|nr:MULTISPECIES: beta-carotene 15,15'-monooxygenase [Epilithonimonas]ROI11661.1 beta-carotene 15,15'-monooxygenase [Epilithonimonas hominis]
MDNFSEFDTRGVSPIKETGAIISHAFENYKTIILYSIVTLIGVAIVSSIVSSILQSLVGYDSLEAQEIINDSLRNGDYSAISHIPGFRATMGLSFFVGVLFYPIYPGILNVLNKANYKQKIEFSDLFIGYKQNTGNIILFLVIANIAISILFVMCILPAIFIAPFFFLGLPIVFFENKSVGDTLSKSFELTKENYGVLLGASFLGILISFCGVFLCGVGIIFTGFFFIAVMYSAYCAICGAPRQLTS